LVLKFEDPSDFSHDEVGEIYFSSLEVLRGSGFSGGKILKDP